MLRSVEAWRFLTALQPFTSNPVSGRAKEGLNSPLSAPHCLFSPTVRRRQRGRVPGRPVPSVRAGRGVSSRPRVGGQRPVGVQAVLPAAGRRPSAQRASAPPPHTDVHAEGWFAHKHTCAGKYIHKTHIKRLKMTFLFQKYLLFYVKVIIHKISIMDDLQKCGLKLVTFEQLV